MNTKVKPIPDGFHALTPYLIVKGAAQAMEFYKTAFGATERFRAPVPGGDKIGHAEMVIGDSILMLADDFPNFDVHAPEGNSGGSQSLVLYVADCDAVFNRAVAAGAKVKQPLQNKFYRDRSGCVIDPFGHHWTLMTHVEDVSPEEMDRRMKAELAKKAK